MQNSTSNIVSRLAQALLQGYAWGEGARQKGAAVSLAELPELEAKGLPAAFVQGVVTLLEGEVNADTQDEMDELVDDQEPAEPMREYLADLVALRLIMETEFEEEPEVEMDGHEDPEWDNLDAQFGTRGTELLHVLSYLRDCRMNGEEPSLDGFLEGFTLDEEDENQDDFAVYEELIRHRELEEAPLKQLIQTGNAQREKAMREMFTPLMLFLRDQESEPGTLTLAILNQSATPALHAGLFNLFNVYWTLPEEVLP